MKLGEKTLLCNMGHTKVEETSHNIIVFYHKTAIVNIRRENGVIILDSGGFRTISTRRRMNLAAEEFNLSFHVVSKRSKWLVDVRGERRPFSDLMHIYRGERT